MALGFSLYDLLNDQGDSSRYDTSGRYDVYDMPNAGPAPTPTPTTQVGMGMQPQPPGFLQSLEGLAKQQTGAAKAPTLGYKDTTGGTTPIQLQGNPSGSAQGLLANSRKGVDLQTVMAIASLFFGGGAGMMGGMMGGMGGAAGGAEAAGGGGGMGNIMGMMGGGGGGGGGGGQQAPKPISMVPAPPVQRGPLLPQGMDQSWMFA